MLSIALVVATGVNADGDREVLGCDVGLSEEAAFWTASLRDLKARGLTGVQLVISDAHTGLQQAIRTVLQGASWQRCRVHFLRNCLAHIPKSAQALTATLVRTIFVHPDRSAAQAQLTTVVATLGERYPQAAAVLQDAAEDILAYMAFPPETLLSTTTSRKPLLHHIPGRDQKQRIAGLCP